MCCSASANGTRVIQMEKQTYFLPQDAYAQVVYIQKIKFFYDILSAYGTLFYALFFSEMYHDSVCALSKTCRVICFFFSVLFCTSACFLRAPSVVAAQYAGARENYKMRVAQFKFPYGNQPVCCKAILVSRPGCTYGCEPLSLDAQDVQLTGR